MMDYKPLRCYYIIHGFLLCCLLSFTHQAQAQASGFGIEYGAGGTLGAGVSLSYSQDSRFSYRLTDYTYTKLENKESIISESTFRYADETNADSTGVIANYHPFKGRFYVAGGIYQSNISREIDGVGTKTEGVFGIPIYTSRAKVGLQVSYDSQSPYVGIGWGKKHSQKKGFGVRAEVGVFKLSKPEVSYYLRDVEISYAGSPYTDKFNGNEEQELRDEIENNQIPNVQKKAEELKQYTVLDVTISYHF